VRKKIVLNLILISISTLFLRAQDRMILQYDAKNVTTISGSIKEVEEANWYAKDQANLIAKIVDQSGKEALVDLGPARLHKEKPEPGQELVSKGCLVKVKDKAYFLSSQVTINQNSAIKIRNRKGVPVWIENSKKGFTYKMNRMKRMKRMRKAH